MEHKIIFYINDKLIKTNAHPSMVLLDFLRNEMHLKGTKEGCREGDCGACTVLLGTVRDGTLRYKSVNSCLVPIGDLHAAHIVSIEGINGNELNPVQQAMVLQGGSQCGFCTPGFVMSMTGFLINEPNPTVESGISSLDGNICRCTGYTGIKRALHSVLDGVSFSTTESDKRIVELIDNGLLPAYFGEIGKLLTEIPTEERQIPESNEGIAVGGGTDIFVQRWESMLEQTPDFIPQVKINNEIKEVNGTITMGGGVTVSEFIASPIIQSYFPKIVTGLRLFGSLLIRNRATIAGNIVNASPIADMVNVLIALDGVLELQGSRGLRYVPLRKFYTGYKQMVKEAGELITSISFKIPGQQFRYNYEKVSRREFLDIATVNTTMLVEYDGNVISAAAISAGGVAPYSLFLEKASQTLIGKVPTKDVLLDVIQAVNNEIAPISDARGSAEYKRVLLIRLIKAHFIEMFPEHITAEEVI